MKQLAWLAGLTTLVVAAAYSIVSLHRWEWTRALYFGLVVLVAEIGLATALILRRLGPASRAPAASPVDIDPLVLHRLRQSRPTPNRFDWLDPQPTRLDVFITMLVGSGVLLSAAAWLVDRIAARTTSPAGEERLARQLSAIRYPRDGLLVDDVAVLAQSVPYCDDVQLRQLLRRAGHGG
jgi:hypothetical protein